MLVRFTLDGAPVTTNQGYHSAVRPGGRWGMRARLTLTDAGAAYKARLAAAARTAHRKAGRPPAIEQGAIVGVRFVFPTLATDADGPLKFVVDSVSPGTRAHPGAGLVVNDNRVRDIVLQKADCDGRPRTEVAIASPDEPGCPHCGCLCRTLLGPRSATP